MNIRLFLHLVKFDLKLFYSRKERIFYPLFFYLITILSFVLTIKPETSALKSYTVTMLAVALLFASTMATSYVFVEDYRDGLLEQLSFFGVPKYVMVLSKIISHWLVLTLPIILVIPLINIMLLSELNYTIWLITATFFTSLIISCFGVFSSVITIGIPYGANISIVLSIPFSLSSLILFALSMNDADINRFSIIQLFIGMLCIVLPTICFLGGMMLKDVSNNFKN